MNCLIVPKFWFLQSTTIIYLLSNFHIVDCFVGYSALMPQFNRETPSFSFFISLFGTCYQVLMQVFVCAQYNGVHFFTFSSLTVKFVLGCILQKNLLLKAPLRTTQRSTEDMFLYGETVLLTSENLISRERTFIFHNLNNHKITLWSLKFMQIIFTSVYSAANEKLCFH
jgi:hypothetical protein